MSILREFTYSLKILYKDAYIISYVNEYQREKI